MKRKSFGVLFFINKAKLLKSGEAGIYIRINVDGKRAEANIKRSVEVKNWDQSREMAKGRDRKSNEINDCIRDLKLRALSIHKELELRGKCILLLNRVLEMKKIEISDNGQVKIPAEVTMMDFEIAQLFRVTISMVRAKIKATMKSKIVSCGAKGNYIANHIFLNGFDLAMVISVAFQVDSYESDLFRKHIIRHITRSNTQPIYIALPSNQVCN